MYLDLVLRKGIPCESSLQNPAALSDALQEVFDDSSNVVTSAIATEIGKVSGIKLDHNQGHLESIELACKQFLDREFPNYSNRYSKISLLSTRDTSLNSTEIK